MSWSGRIAGDRDARWATIWWAVAGVLLVIAAVLLAVGLRGRQPSLPGPPVAATSRLSTPTPRPSSTVAATAAVKPLKTASRPVSLRIPAIGVSVPVGTLGLKTDGTVEVPTDYQSVGWFRLGPTPGQVGSAVVLGHVDSQQGPAIFFRLRDLRPGDRVDVSLADGAVAHFAVTKVMIYPKDRFPARLVYASHGYSALQLVTCGGIFDPKAHSYLSNVVAFTTLESISAVGN